MNGELTFLRKWNPNRDRGRFDGRYPKDRGVYVHAWPSGHQTLVFDSDAEAALWARAEGVKFNSSTKGATK